MGGGVRKVYICWFGGGWHRCSYLQSRAHRVAPDGGPLAIPRISVPSRRIHSTKTPELLYVCLCR